MVRVGSQAGWKEAARAARAGSGAVGSGSSIGEQGTGRNSTATSIAACSSGAIAGFCVGQGRCKLSMLYEFGNCFGLRIALHAGECWVVVARAQET